MKTLPSFKIVILEDDDFYNRLLSKYLKNALSELGIVRGFNLELTSYTSYRDCTLNFENDTLLLFTDYYLKNGYCASNIIEFINMRGSECKIIVVSQIQNLQTAICTILEGATDFIKKDKYTLRQCQDIAETIITEKLAYKN